MFSYRELMLGCVYAMAYIGMFSLHRVIDAVFYFSSGELVYGLRSHIRPIALIIRALLIILFSVITYSMTDSNFAVYFAVSGGSFLIVWPAIIQPLYYGEPRLAHKRLLLFGLYIFFIASAVALANFGLTIEPLIRSFTTEYISIVKQPGWLINFTGTTILATIVSFIFVQLVKLANREIELNEQHEQVLSESEFAREFDYSRHETQTKRFCRKKLQARRKFYKRK